MLRWPSDTFSHHSAFRNGLFEREACCKVHDYLGGRHSKVLPAQPARVRITAPEFFSEDSD